MLTDISKLRGVALRTATAHREAACAAFAEACAAASSFQEAERPFWDRDELRFQTPPLGGAGPSLIVLCIAAERLASARSAKEFPPGHRISGWPDMSYALHTARCHAVRVVAAARDAGIVLPPLPDEEAGLTQWAQDITALGV